MNIAAMMKQAQAMQSKMQDVQARLAATEFTGTAGGGSVSITLTGKGEARAVKLDPAVVVAAEKELLEDLILTAINDARSKSDAATAAEMKAVMGGLNLPPGLQLPF
jgi:DNA-binding YbaB/EbfC family protein